MSKTNLLNSKVAVAGVLVVGGLVLAAVTALGAKRAATAAVTAINPANPDNIFNSGVNSLGQQISGNNNWSLGGWIYDVVNGSSAEQSARREESNFIKSIGG